MAKELPYFKFYVSEWNDGDITLEDLETQGLFINICSVYWSKKGQITLTKLKRRFSQVKPTAFDSLINEGIIKIIDNDLISISFLNEQIEESNKRSIQNAKNGAKGGRPKSEIKPTALFSDSETKPKKSNKEEKRGEEKRGEDIEKPIFSDDVNFLYSLYPTKCPTKGNSLGKGEKNKKQLEKLLKTKTKEELKEVIEFYVEDCKKTKTYLKNFQTFLNNLPEVVKEEPVIYWRNDHEPNDIYHETKLSDMHRYFDDYKNNPRCYLYHKKPDFKRLTII